MAKIEREDIQIISQHSNWSEWGIQKILLKEVYSSKSAWQKFLRLFLICLGVGFTVAGIIFFFAYNWAELHKFVKIGLIVGLLVGITLVVVFAKLQLDIKNILLTGASVLVGVLFAVFGQIYQTGANAYDFFLGWTMAITLWVVIANFAPLWLVFIALINTTLILFSEQVAHNWTPTFLFTLLFLINGCFLLASTQLYRLKDEFRPPQWFEVVLVLATAVFATIGLITGIFDNFKINFILLAFLVVGVYSLGIMHGVKTQNTLYLSVIPLSIIVVATAFFIKLSDEAGMFFFISLFVVGSVTLVIKKLIDLQRQWRN